MNKKYYPSFKSLEQAKEFINVHNLGIQFLTNLDPLKQAIQIEDFTIPNRIVIQPMEGCDADLKGNPGDYTFRRYARFGKSGAGIVWFEATAVVPEGRANPHQLMLYDANKNKIKELLDVFDAQYAKLNLPSSKSPPLRILQLTHSGRYSKPSDKIPQRLYPCSFLDHAYGLSADMGTILSDQYLESLVDKYLHAAKLAQEIGFDGVDIKACHRYLLNESFSAFTRKDSKYGGVSLENRTRLFRSIIQKLFEEFDTEHFLITTRLNIYDGLVYPYGWGTLKEPHKMSDLTPHDMFHTIPTPDLREPIRLINQLYNYGVRLINLTMGNPYFNSYITRPYSTPLPKTDPSPEHPIKGVNRLIQLPRNIKAQVPDDLILLGSGYSWLGEFSPHAAAYEINNRFIDLVGWGRMSLAYPDFPKDILIKNRLEKQKICITCSKCTDLMRMGGATGCVVRDSDIYGQKYQKLKKFREQQHLIK